MPAPTREFLLQLLKDARIKGPELDERVTRALDENYWRALVPEFHIGDAAGAPSSLSPDDGARINDAIRSNQQDGYFRVNGVLAPAAIAGLNRALDAVASAGWPSSFVFVFDEAWQAARAPVLKPILESVLGPGYRQICHVWAHVVKPVVGASGWSPHTDGHTDTNPRGRMSVWLGLTEATLDNGCMHVVPRKTTESSPDLIPRFQKREGQFMRAEVASLLQAAHALPTAPGDALGWGFDIIHWGGVVRRSGPERRGFSFEFLAADETPDDKDGLVTPMESLPPFDVRLRSIATAVVAYRRFEPVVDRFAGVAEAIKKHLGPPDEPAAPG